MPGEIIVRKFTNEDYERLVDLEQRWHARGKTGDEAFQLALADLERYKIQPFGEARTHNMFMRATGRKRLWERVTGIAAPTLFDNTNAKLGVGDSLTAVAETQTDLQAATNKLRKAMSATYPSIEGSPNDHKLDLRADFISGEAEFTWNEAATFNAAAAGDMFNRGLFSPSPGTKPTGQVWTLSETLVIT
jgi:hypothetical protein